jgi:hypothetical protein
MRLDAQATKTSRAALEMQNGAKLEDRRKRTAALKSSAGPEVVPENHWGV